MSEVFLTQLYFLLSLPGAYLSYGGELFGYWIFLYLIIWLVIGVWVSKFVLQRFHKPAFILWVSIWFFPATIICGSAAVLPWFLVGSHILPFGQCSTALSLLINLALNILLVSLSTIFLSRYRIVKA